jgi:SAM-dependent methyltransferase
MAGVPQRALPRFRQDLLERVPCAICGQDDTATFVQGRGPRQIVRCKRDGLLFVNPRPVRERLQVVGEQFVNERNRALFESQRDAMLRREAEAILAVKSGGALLDVGCATGQFFKNFPASWRLFGVEPCLYAVEQAKGHYNAEVRHGSLIEARWPAQSFDVVTIIDALYYFADPLDDLREAGRILKSDGILALEIPGYTHKLLRDRGPLCLLLDRKWSRLDPDGRPLYHYSPRTLSLLLRKAGFIISKRLVEQAPLGRSGIADAMNWAHYGFTRAVFGMTAGHLSLAAKEFYLCRKA